MQISSFVFDLYARILNFKIGFAKPKNLFSVKTKTNPKDFNRNQTIMLRASRKMPELIKYCVSL